MTPIAMMFFCGVLGLLVGSFLNVAIYRLPIIIHNSWEEECKDFLKQASPLKSKIFSLFFPRSHCPHCKNIVPWWCNVPIISFLFLRGRCRDCSLKISWRYPLVELLTAITSILVGYHFGLQWQTPAALIITWGLLVLTFIDLEHQILPDCVTLLLLWFALGCNSFNLFTTPVSAILGAISAYAFLWLIALVFKLVRKVEGMGHGDFKLFAVFGAWFGWQILPFILLGASLVGAGIGVVFLFATKKSWRTTPIPFGPFLALAGWAALFLV